MEQNIVIAGATFNGVPSIEIPTSGGGSASFVEVSDTTATAADVAQGKYFYTANGVKTAGAGGGSAVVQPLSVTENGTYNPPSGVDGYAPVTVNVSGGGGINWHDPLCVNWDFANPVNTRGGASYSGSSLIYTLDGWQLQGGVLTFASGGIQLERYNAGTAGYFMQRFKRDATTALSGQTATLSVIIDGVLYSATETITSGSGNKMALDAGGLSVRLYNYGSEAAITFDIGVGNESRLIQAVKFEAGSTQSLATQSSNVLTLNNSMDANTEYIRARNGTVFNS